jgi:hypothetical protein
LITPEGDQGAVRTFAAASGLMAYWAITITRRNRRRSFRTLRVIAYRLTAAYAEVAEGKGQPGAEMADLAVLSQDIFRIPNDDGFRRVAERSASAAPSAQDLVER